MHLSKLLNTGKSLKRKNERPQYIGTRVGSIAVHKPRKFLDYYCVSARLVLVYAFLEFMRVKETSRDHIAVEYPTFQSIDGLSSRH